jgi:hypothetical protein
MFPVCSGQGYQKPTQNYSGGISTSYFLDLEGLLHSACEIVHLKTIEDKNGRRLVTISRVSGLPWRKSVGFS